MSISYYSSSLSKIGVGYNFKERFWSELRLYSNTTLDNITPELVLFYNIVKKGRFKVIIKKSNLKKQMHRLGWSNSLSLSSSEDK